MPRSKLFALVVFGLGLALLVTVSPGLSQEEAAYEKWGLLVDVVTNIKQKYVDEVSDEELWTFQALIEPKGGKITFNEWAPHTG